MSRIKRAAINEFLSNTVSKDQIVSIPDHVANKNEIVDGQNNDILAYNVNMTKQYPQTKRFLDFFNSRKYVFGVQFEVS